MNTFRVFDIETTALPEDDIKDLLPEFNPPENIKDPAKITERWKAHMVTALEKAALSALTGRVVAVGVKWSGEEPEIIAANYTHFVTEEMAVLQIAWDRILKMSTDMRIPYVVGFNSHSFDLPFLIQRSIILGVEVPSGVRNGRYFDRRFIDLRDLWQCGNKQSQGSLDTICQASGLGKKNGSGKDFGKLWETDRTKAIEYLKNDLVMTEQLALRMGVGSMSL